MFCLMFCLRLACFAACPQWGRDQQTAAESSAPGDNGVDNQTLLAVNEAIASHPVEVGML